MGAATSVASSTAAPPGVGRSPESAPLSPQTVPSTERLNSPRPDRLGARLARWAKRAASPLARLRSLASGKKDKALDPKPVQTTSERLPGHHATNSAPQGDTAIGMLDVQTPEAAVRDSAGPATPGEPLPSGGQSGGSEAQANMREAATEEQQLDQALLVDWSVDQIFTGEDASSQQQKAEILNPLAKKPVAEIPDESLINAVHHGRRISELAKALKDRADADPNGFGIKLQVAQQEEQKQRVEAWRKVGVQMGPNGDVVVYPDKPYAAIRAKLDAVTGDTPEATAARQKIWQEALRNDSVLVKTLALYHSPEMPFAQGAFEVVRQKQEVKDAKGKVSELFDHFAKLPIAQESVDLVHNPTMRRQAERFVGFVFRKQNEIHAIVENAVVLAKVKEELQNAEFDLESVQEAQGVMEQQATVDKAIEEFNQRLIQTRGIAIDSEHPEKGVVKERELANIENAQRLLKGIKAQVDGELPPQSNETPEQNQQKKNARQRQLVQDAMEVATARTVEAKDNLKVPEAAFSEALSKVPQKTNNQFYNSLVNLPDYLLRYPQMGKQLEELNRIGGKNKRLRPLLILLIVFALGSAPLIEEFQKIMRVQ